jgi:hypothetical protein
MAPETALQATVRSLRSVRPLPILLGLVRRKMRRFLPLTDPPCTSPNR